MKRLLLLNLVAILLFSGESAGSPARFRMLAEEIPDAVTVEIILVNSPGITHEASSWEIAYEFRIATDAMVWEANKKRQSEPRNTSRAGELINQGVVKKSLRPPGHRRIVLQFPLNRDIQERLRNHPRDRVKLTPGNVTPEQIKLAKEQEMKSQSFLFYPVISVFDAQLKKTIVMQFPQVWSFSGSAKPRYEIKVVVNPDGSYSVNRTLPTRARLD